MTTSTLASPLTLPNGTTLPNRFAKSAASEVLAETGNRAGRRLAVLYRRWARGGTGLLITGNVIVRSDGRTEPNNVVLENDDYIDGLRQWAAAAHEHGSHIWMQLNHAGRQSPRRSTLQAVAPSPVPLKGYAGMFSTPRELPEDEIQELIARFARAAGIAKAAGFDGVQIHGAHGYLVAQFLSPLTNRRTDRWGGSIENRARFLLEIVRAIRAEVGAEFPIGVKLNSADFQRGGFSEDESMQVVSMLEAEGIELLEISGGNYEAPAMMGARASTRAREAYFLEYAKTVRKRTNLPLMLTGGLRTGAVMAEVIDSGAVDMIGMARPLLVEPDLPAKIMSGEVDGATSHNLSVGVRLFDDVIQLIWYQRQMARMAAGLDPDPGLSRWWSVVLGFGRTFAFNPFKLVWRKPRRAIAAGSAA